MDKLKRILKLSIIPIGFLQIFLMQMDSIRADLNYNHNENNNTIFESVPTTVKTYENDTVMLPCTVNSPQFYTRWYRENDMIIDSRHQDVPPPERYHLWPNGTLQVTNVQTEDTGDFRCEVINQSGIYGEQEHAIEVQYAPTVITSPSGTVEFQIGTVFEIICEAKGYPNPIITWRRKGIDQPNQSDRLENRKRHLVEIESRDDSGPIECVAENGVGEPAVDGIYLNVLFPPEIKVLQSIVHTKINMRAHLECIVISAPPAKVQWYHHGVPVTTDMRIARNDVEIHRNRSQSHYYTETKHQLVVKKVRDSDLGMYECRAENKVGFKSSTIELTGRPMPCLFKTSPVQQPGTAHTLIWQTESLSPISEYKLKFRQVPSGNVTPQNRPPVMNWNELTIPAEFSEGSIHVTTYTLRGLQPASVYEVAVTARNRFGWSDNSKIIRFATGGEVELNYSTETHYTSYDDFEDNFLNDHSVSSVQQYSAASPSSPQSPSSSPSLSSSSSSSSSQVTYARATVSANNYIKFSFSQYLKLLLLMIFYLI
ncbi:protein amalgam [Condylostylus longicornis]|uniref:protein amalgam n=1 Tax=Condylostylus longicornis TaxID=2530218 RepID=UPI00244DBE1F|nr:protein amalgam [Condylostylus longicornis]